MAGKISLFKNRLFAKRKIRKIDSAVGPKDDIDIQDNYEERGSGIRPLSLDLKPNWSDITRKFKLNTN
jgi:hypothetical protein